MADRIVTVFGASGFLGRHIVQALARAGWRIRAAQRRPNLAHFLRPMGMTGQIHPVQANIRNEKSIAAAINGADAVINLVGILSQGGAQKFSALHEEGAASIAKICAQNGIQNLIHISALGVDKESASRYGRSKAAGEARIREYMPDAIIIRPSVVFGPEDQFFNLFAALARLSPILPLIGGGKTRLQPVYVGDVAKAVSLLLEDQSARGKIYELGGPDILTLEEVWKFVLKVTGRRRILLPVPFWAAEIKAVFLGLLPNPPLTRDQVRMLKSDNVVSNAAIGERRTLEGLNITANTPQAIIPTYLARFRKAGEFSRLEDTALNS